MSETPNAAASGQFAIGGDLTVNRLGFGAMRITGEGVWGPPADRAEALRTLKRLPELGVNFIDTADAYGPEVSEDLIAEALSPYDAASPAPPPASGTPSAAPNICASACK
jgi:aryl-alcohol dehydrogenase-like predicted oxidoreductase